MRLNFLSHCEACYLNFCWLVKGEKSSYSALFELRITLPGRCPTLPVPINYLTFPVHLLFFLLLRCSRSPLHFFCSFSSSSIFFLPSMPNSCTPPSSPHSSPPPSPHSSPSPPLSCRVYRKELLNKVFSPHLSPGPSYKIFIVKIPQLQRCQLFFILLREFFCAGRIRRERDGKKGGRW